MDGEGWFDPTATIKPLECRIRTTIVDIYKSIIMWNIIDTTINDSTKS